MKKQSIFQGRSVRKLNSQNRYYLKVLRAVLKNFMTNPVYVRDIAHNIKGFMNEENIRESNLKIEVTK